MDACANYAQHLTDRTKDCLLSALRRKKAKIWLLFSFFNKGAYGKIMRAKLKDGVEIEAITKRL